MPRIHAALLLFTISLAIPASSEPRQSYDETQRVTAIDLIVELQSATQRSDKVRKPPEGLLPEDFQLLLDGDTRPVTGAAPVASSAPIQYQVVIYVDPTMVDSYELQCSLELLASMSMQLVETGAVDLVVANPEPRFVLRQVGDPEMIENLVASYDWQQEAGDEIRALRARFVETLAETESAQELQALRAALVEEEGRLVQERLDLLLAFLADQDLPGRHRALLLVGINFDLDPASFYAAWGDGTSGPEQPSSIPGPPLESISRSTAAALTAYGWINYPLAAPAREVPLVPGIRIGKWRVAGPAGGRILGLKITHESERDPELAGAHLENGQALLAAGRLPESEEAFRLALHHYYGDPRTATQQAEALLGLADALDGQGLGDEARAMRVLAGELDSSVAVEDPTALVTLLAPAEPLEILAAESSGRIIHDRDDLELSLLGLRRRLRLTFQLSGDPPGEVLPVEVKVARQGWRVISPRWVRFGTPPWLSQARTRLLAAGDTSASPLILDARVRQSAADGEVTVEFQLPLESAEGEAPVEGNQACRLSRAWLVEGKTPQIEQQTVSCLAVDQTLTGSVAVEASADSELLALVVEHLASGAWGAEIFEIDSAPS